MVGYLSFSVPAIIAGSLSAAVGLERVAEVYAAVLVVLALTAVAGVRMRRRRAAGPERPVGAAQESLAA